MTKDRKLQQQVLKWITEYADDHNISYDDPEAQQAVADALSRLQELKERNNIQGEVGVMYNKEIHSFVFKIPKEEGKTLELSPNMVLFEEKDITDEENDNNMKSLLEDICKDWKVSSSDKKVIKQLNDTLEQIYRNTFSQESVCLKYNKETHKIEDHFMGSVTSYDPFQGKRVYPSKRLDSKLVASLIHDNKK